MIKNVDIFLTPLKTDEIINKITISAEKLNENGNETSEIFENNNMQGCTEWSMGYGQGPYFRGFESTNASKNTPKRECFLMAE